MDTNGAVVVLKAAVNLHKLLFIHSITIHNLYYVKGPGLNNTKSL